MAENKKSFLAYCDWAEVFNSLPDDKAGQLVKHLFDYVNDKNPETDDLLIKIAFTSIKQTLKRDLRKYEQYIEKQKINGKKGGRPKKEEKPKKPKPFLENPTKPKKADSVSDSVSVNVIDNNINTLSYKESEFFNDWNKTRTEILKTPSHVNRLSFEAKNEFRQLSKSYSRDDFTKALRGLFRQKNLRPVMQSNPTHFLKFFDNYLQAYHDKNTNVYGTKTH